MDLRSLHPDLVSQLSAEGVDLDRMLRFLDDLNAGKFGSLPSGGPYGIPAMLHPSIVDRCVPASWTMSLADARARFDELALGVTPESLGTLDASAGDAVRFDEAGLRTIGIRLYPKTAFGVLNGGAATSYADVKKNRSLAGGLFESYRSRFESLAESCGGLPKGITPAFINADGTAGDSFLLLKLRMLLLHRLAYAELTGGDSALALPAFQMTSVHTDEAIASALDEYSDHPWIVPLARRAGMDGSSMLTGCQTMMAAITHSSEGMPRRLFDRAWGKENAGIAMPGGHGQNFEVLAPVYRALLERGVRYAWLGNIDNMGFTVDPVSLAVFALSGRTAAFEESFRTPMDVKGGILVRDGAGRFTCADIGPAISTEEMLAFERAGNRVLFNCGIGLFDLERLVPLLDELPFRLPLRITDQDKDAGLYAQAEQITWEVIGLLEDPLFFAVDKKRRFIAAKMLMETLMTSLPPDGTDGTTGAIGAVSAELHSGLVSLLEGEYGLRRVGARWCPGNK